MNGNQFQANIGSTHKATNGINTNKWEEHWKDLALFAFNRFVQHHFICMSAKDDTSNTYLQILKTLNSQSSSQGQFKTSAATVKKMKTPTCAYNNALVWISWRIPMKFGFLKYFTKYLFQTASPNEWRQKRSRPDDNSRWPPWITAFASCGSRQEVFCRKHLRFKRNVSDIWPVKTT